MTSPFQNDTVIPKGHGSADRRLPDDESPAETASLWPDLSVSSRNGDAPSDQLVLADSTSFT